MRFHAGTSFARAATIAVFLAAACASTEAHAELGAPARSKADAWLGRDSGDLLRELRVDGGRVQIVEDDQTLETRYTWSTSDPAWVERNPIGGGELLYMESTGNGTRPVFAPIIYEEIQHPVAHRCDITYVADKDGVVRRWTHAGRQCDTDIVGPAAQR